MKEGSIEIPANGGRDQERYKTEFEKAFYIRTAKNLDDLLDFVLPRVAEFPEHNGKIYSVSDLSEIINRVRDGVLECEAVPDIYNLQDVVSGLISSEDLLNGDKKE